MTEGVHLASGGDLTCDGRKLRALGDDGDGEAFAGLPTLLEESDDVIHVDGAAQG